MTVVQWVGRTRTVVPTTTRVMARPRRARRISSWWSWRWWWRTERRDYLESLGYSAENQNSDGSFNNTIGKPGNWKDGDIDLPAFTPFTFLEQRDIYFGVRFYF